MSTEICFAEFAEVSERLVWEFCECILSLEVDDPGCQSSDGWRRPVDYRWGRPILRSYWLLT